MATSEDSSADVPPTLSQIIPSTLSEIFTLNEEAWNKFQAVLDAEARDMPKLRLLMSRTPPWADE